MTAPPALRATPESVGRYSIHGEIASGGMATVYFGRLAGPIGFSRIVAIKRMHVRLAKEPEFIAMFVDEATVASRVVHPNVVATLDIVVEEGEIFIVMDYVRGQSLSALLGAALRSGEKVPVPVAASIMSGVLAGLHAAHEARDKNMRPLGIVHRDISPHNILVGADGIARIMDFGIAKAERRLHVPAAGEIVGKLSYMAPEQLRGDDVDRRVDVFAAAVVLWGMLAGRRLFRGEDASIMNELFRGEVPPLSQLRDDVPPALEAALALALARDRDKRTKTARDLALALEAACPLASAHAVGVWVESLAGPLLAEREAVIAQIENTSRVMSREALAEVSGASADRAAGARASDSSAPTRTWSPSTLETSAATSPTVAGSPATPSGVSVEPSLPAKATPEPPRAPRFPMALVAATAGFAAIALIAAVVAVVKSSAPPMVEQSAAIPPAPTTASAVLEELPSASPPAASATVTAVASSKALPSITAPRPLLKPRPSKSPTTKPGDDIGFIPTNNK